MKALAASKREQLERWSADNETTLVTLITFFRSIIKDYTIRRDNHSTDHRGKPFTLSPNLDKREFICDDGDNEGEVIIKKWCGHTRMAFKSLDVHSDISNIVIDDV